jgi:hypothetical protein
VFFEPAIPDPGAGQGETDAPSAGAVVQSVADDLRETGRSYYS